MNYIITSSEMRAYVATRSDLSERVKQMILAGTSATTGPRGEVLGTEEFAAANWKTSKTVRRGLPESLGGLASAATGPSRTEALLKTAAELSERAAWLTGEPSPQLYELELDDGTEQKRTAEQIRGLVSAGKAHDMCGVRKVGTTHLKFLREFPELLPSPKFSAPAPKATPVAAPAHRAPRGPSKIVASATKAALAELERDPNQPARGSSIVAGAMRAAEEAFNGGGPEAA